MVLIFSFDPAVKNLGFCVLKLQKGGFDILKLEVWNILSQGYTYHNQPKYITAANLKNELQLLDEWQMEEYPDEKIVVLCEYIMSQNNKIGTVADYIIYHYAGEENIKIYEKVPPALKNKLYFTDSLMYSVFAERYSKSYDANKKHAEENFLWFCKNCKEKLPEAKHIRLGPKFDDLADAFMQALAMIRYGKISLDFGSIAESTDSSSSSSSGDSKTVFEQIELRAEKLSKQQLKRLDEPDKINRKKYIKKFKSKSKSKK